MDDSESSNNGGSLFERVRLGAGDRSQGRLLSAVSQKFIQSLGALLFSELLEWLSYSDCALYATPLGSDQCGSGEDLLAAIEARCGNEQGGIQIKVA